MPRAAIVIKFICADAGCKIAIDLKNLPAVPG